MAGLAGPRPGGLPPDEVHQIELHADHPSITAECAEPRDRHVAVLQRTHDAHFPVEGMGRLEQLARGLRAQDIVTTVAGRQLPDRIGVATDQTLRLDRAPESLDRRLQPGLQARQVERGCADNASHGWAYRLSR